jgi:LytS/YehU family sensor histidine kinase
VTRSAPRIAPTEIVVSARRDDSALTISVRDSGEAVPRDGTSAGIGLARLRERLTVLYGNAATLTSGPVDGGYEAILVIPQSRRSPHAAAYRSSS